MSSFNGFKEVTEKLDTLDFNPYKKIGKEWFLVTAGDESGWNTMTASWGFAGVMWGKNTFTTVIRPQRYTKEFIDASDTVTLSLFDEKYRSALNLCGKKSGRDGDKLTEAGLDVITENNAVKFDFGRPADAAQVNLADAPVVADCPLCAMKLCKCTGAKLVDTGNAYVCRCDDAKDKKCNFRLSKTMLTHKITVE